MKYLLDTNICVHFFRGKFGVLEKIEHVGFENCAISEITVAELVFGAENSENPSKNLSIVQGFTSAIIVLPIFDSISMYAKEKSRLRKIGQPISDFDLFIGATALEREMILVTENTRELERLSGIKIENWVAR